MKILYDLCIPQNVSSHGEYGNPADEGGDGLGLWVRTLTLQLGAEGRGGGGGLLPIQ